MIWRNRSLVGLVAAELVSFTGSSMTYVALPWFVLATTGSVSKMGWVLGAEMLPLGLLGLPAGSLIARLGAKRTMLVSDAARVPLMLVLPILDWTGHLSFGALLGASFAIGCFSVPYFGSSTLIVPEVTGEDERVVAEVQAVLGGLNQATRIAGPVLAGVLIAATSPAAVLVVDGATYLFSFLTIALVVSVGRRVDETEESKGMLSGLRFLLHDPLLGPMMLAACGINLFVQGLSVGVNALAYFDYRSAHVAGLLFGAFGVGALLGSVVAQQLARRVDLLALAAFAMVALPLPLFALGLSLPWGVAMVVLGGFTFFTPLINAPVMGILTVRTPVALRPKVMTAVMMVVTAAGPLGFFGSGLVLRWISIQQLFCIVASTCLVGGLVFAGAVFKNRDAPASSVPELVVG